MGILNFASSGIGTAGQIPSLIYFNTDDSVATVTTSGYLNKWVEQGNLIAETQLAIIVTKTSPGARASTTGIYSISFSTGDWVLTEIAGPTAGNPWLLGGNSVNAAQVFGTTTNEQISFRANDDDYMLFEPAFNRLSIVANNLRINTTNTVQIDSADVILDASVGVFVGNIGTPFVNIGNNSSPTHFVSIESPILKTPHLVTATKANVIYFDSVSKEWSYGIAPTSFDPASNQTITGDWDFTGDFSVDLTGNNLNLETTTNVNITGGGDVDITANNDFVFSAGDEGFINADTVLAIGTLSTPLVVIGSNSVGTNEVNINAPILEFTNLATATAGNILYFDSSTKRVTYGTAPSVFNPAADEAITGDWSFLGDFAVNSPSTVSIDSAVDINLTAIGNVGVLGANLALNAFGDIEVAASGTVEVSGVVGVDLGTTLGPIINIGNNGVGTNSVNVASPVVTLTNIPSATKTNVLYYDSSTKVVSYSALPTTLSNVAANDSNVVFTIADNRNQTCNPTAARTYTLPTTSVSQGYVMSFTNRSLFVITLNSSGGNFVATVFPLSTTVVESLVIAPTTAANWLMKSAVSYAIASYTPTMTGTGYGTVTNLAGRTYRTGNMLYIEVSWTCGNVTTSSAYYNPPFGYTVDGTGLTINNALGSDSVSLGKYSIGNVSTVISTGNIIMYPTGNAGQIYLTARYDVAGNGELQAASNVSTQITGTNTLVISTSLMMPITG